MDSISNIAVGLDIGTTKITVIVGRKNEHGKIEILGIPQILFYYYFGHYP